MRRLVNVFVLGLLLALGASLSGAAAAERAGVLREIVVEGAQRIEADTVRSYMLIQEGDIFSTERLDRSLKSLFATGLFADVTLRRQDDRLVVTVVENPVINQLAFEGNQHLKEEELKAEVVLKPRIVYTRTKVQGDVNRILTLYRRGGRFAATVVPKIIQLPQNRVDLIFEVSEGELTDIERIRFVGNGAFSDSRLREVIRTKESRWYRFFTADDTYDPDRLTLDRELLRRFYLENGHADFRVVSAVAELTPEPQSTFSSRSPINEGDPATRFGSRGHARFACATSKSGGTALEIDRVRGQAIITTPADIGRYLSDSLTPMRLEALGYAFVDVRPAHQSRTREEKTIDVTFEVGEGPRVFVERIEITGNVRTIDEVHPARISPHRRVMPSTPPSCAGRRQRIQNLGFFREPWRWRRSPAAPRTRP